MPRTDPISDETRERILALHAEGRTRNDIARDVGVSGSTVTKVVKAAGRSFDRAATKAATEARKVDLAERRARLRAKYLQRAEELLDQMDKPHLVFNFGGKDNTYEERTLDRPPVKDIRDLMQAASTATNAELRIAAAESDTNAEAARSVLVGLANALGVHGPDSQPGDDAPA
ncbi:helix-turn-helix domain-containing protein [uncultured Aeromicrobium sp.]|uniref:helix-turn-helix domain-containing protein n=1 Tax=uncultured Aeromicrobium sp. TaxID=337820 RepID=UPI0026008FC4|nr:helix-turn-helix domain-containing protein [uncultured Aeromicrobium sp.]